jgi:hypothetical protein
MEFAKSRLLVHCLSHGDRSVGSGEWESRKVAIARTFATLQAGVIALGSAMRQSLAATA